MAGPWPLAPHHDHLQYIHHIHLMQRGQNRGVTNAPTNFMCMMNNIFSKYLDKFNGYFYSCNVFGHRAIDVTPQF